MNQLRKSFYLPLTVVLILLAMFWLPKIRVRDKDFRRVNILSDVQQRDSDGNIIAELMMDSLLGTIEIAADSVATDDDSESVAFDKIEDEEVEPVVIPPTEPQTAKQEPSKKKDIPDPQKTGAGNSQTAVGNQQTVSVNEGDTAAYHPADIKPIDYSAVSTGDVPDIEDFGGTMSHFRTALAQAGSRPVRIAFFGDSFIEGDILTSDLREMLQGQYGGKGVGWIDISCVSERFRLTAKTNCSGWETHHANDRKGHQGSLQGINGSYFIAKGNASFNVTTSKGHAATADRATVFYVPGGLSFKGRVNGAETQPSISEGGAMAAAVFQS